MGISTDAQRKARNKYEKKTYKQLNLKLRKTQMDILNGYCKEYGVEKYPFVITAIAEKMERDTGKSFDEFLAEKSNENSNK